MMRESERELLLRQHVERVPPLSLSFSSLFISLFILFPILLAYFIYFLVSFDEALARERGSDREREKNGDTISRASEREKNSLCAGRERKGESGETKQLLFFACVVPPFYLWIFYLVFRGGDGEGGDRERERKRERERERKREREGERKRERERRKKRRWG